MKALLRTCLLFAIFSPGIPIECYYCVGEGCATPKIVKCAAHEDSCFSAVSETTLVSGMLPQFQVKSKNCAQASLCFLNDVSISVSDGGKIRVHIKCCYTNRCNVLTVSMPKLKNPIPNGKKCNACFALDATECKEEIISCMDQETRCIQGTAHLNIDFLDMEFDVFFKGCTTPNACYAPLPNLNRTSDKVNLTINKRKCIPVLSGEMDESKLLSSVESTIPGHGVGG